MSTRGHAVHGPITRQQNLCRFPAIVHLYSSFRFHLNQRSAPYLNLWRLTMFTTFKNRAALVRVNAAHKLTRNNLEFAGVVVYFFSLAVAFVMTIIVMMCQGA